MATNGMASSPSSFFPPNFILHMQTTPHEENQNQHQHQHQLTTPPHNPFLPNPQCTNLADFRGMAPMLGKRPMSFPGMDSGGGGGEEANGNDDELSDDGSGVGEKKRRLNVDQVRTLEKNFELGNKLEPERKMQLARALGLQPRQVAIWFQNRRARWKTKQLEKDYNVLKRQFDAVKAENDALQAQNKKLHAEILALKGREASELINLNKETEASCSNRSENSSEINLDISRLNPTTESPMNATQHQHQVLPFYPSMRAGDIDHLLHNHSRAEQLQCPKLEHGVVTDSNNFSNLLCGVDEPPPFWPWAADHHNF